MQSWTDRKLPWAVIESFEATGVRMHGTDEPEDVRNHLHS